MQIAVPVVSMGAQDYDEQPNGSMLAALIQVRTKALLAINQAGLLGGRKYLPL